MGAYADFHRRSIEDRESFWTEEAQRIYWHRPFDQVLDFSKPPFAKWFVGGQTNLCYNAIDRHLDARGDQLGWLTRTMQPHGVIGSFGNAGGIELKTNVLPFILRGVRLIGVDSVATPMALRRKVWGRLATDLKPRHLDSIAQTISLSDLPGYFERMLKGAIRGRAVVRIL